MMELGTSLSVVSSELYRQRSTFVRLEDKVQEIRRTQRTLAMRSTMHGFKLSDLEQFRGKRSGTLNTVLPQRVLPSWRQPSTCNS